MRVPFAFLALLIEGVSCRSQGVDPTASSTTTHQPVLRGGDHPHHERSLDQGETTFSNVSFAMFEKLEQQIQEHLDYHDHSGSHAEHDDSVEEHEHHHYSDEDEAMLASEGHHGEHEVYEQYGDDAHNDHGGHNEMSVHVTYEDIYAILLFLLIATGAGIFFEFLGMPALVGEICTGFLLGPPLADFVPYPEAMVLVGEIGLILLLLEAGVEIDVGQLKQTGTRALAIAGTGSVLPLIVGFGIATLAGESWKGALAVGAAFSPTSLGVASTALGAGGMLNTPVGQLIVGSCVIDDTIALILLAMFQVLVADDPAIYEYFIPILSSFGFLLLLGWAAVFIWPNVIEKQILPKFKEKYQDMVMFSIMGVLLLIYLPLLNYTRASYLTGAFLAGMSFSQIHTAHDSFIKHTHQLMVWLLRVFFAASIGFQIPVTKFSNPAVIGWGFALYAAVAMKFPLGYYVPSFEDVPKDASFNPRQRDIVVTGLAMSCRGEFSFIIASFGLSAGVIGEDVYSAVVWAVLISCVTSPFVLLKAIKYYKKQQKAYMESLNPLLNKDARTKGGKMPLHLNIHIKSRVQWGMQEKFREVCHDLGLQIIEHSTVHQRGVDAVVKTDIYVRDTETVVDLPTIEQQRRDLKTLVQSSRKLLLSERTLSVHSLSSSGSEGELDIKRLSSNQLTKMADLESREFNVDEENVKNLTDIRDMRVKVEDREAAILDAISEAIHQEDATIVVEEWNPWDWTTALETLAEKDGGSLTKHYFMTLFDKIDADGGGTVDEIELYEALVKAGLKITRNSLSTMIAMVDDNNDGEVDRDEWAAAIDFFLEQRAAQKSLRDHGNTNYLRRSSPSKSYSPRTCFVSQRHMPPNFLDPTEEFLAPSEDDTWDSAATKNVGLHIDC